MSEVYLTASDKEFYDLLELMFKAISGRSIEAFDEANDRFYDFFVSSMEHNRLSHAGIITSFNKIATNYKDNNRLFALITRDFVELCEQLGFYQFPELFWIVLSTGILENTETLDEGINYLSVIGDHFVVRDYISARIAGEADQRTVETLLRSYYYTGHTIATLKLIYPILNSYDFGAHLYNAVYITASSSTLKFLETNTPMDEDKAFLTNFFSIENKSIDKNTAKLCWQVIKRLSEI